MKKMNKETKNPYTSISLKPKTALILKTIKTRRRDKSMDETLRWLMGKVEEEVVDKAEKITE